MNIKLSQYCEMQLSGYQIDEITGIITKGKASHIVKCIITGKEKQLDQKSNGKSEITAIIYRKMQYSWLSPIYTYKLI